MSGLSNNTILNRKENYKKKATGDFNEIESIGTQFGRLSISNNSMNGVSLNSNNFV